jgi:hypothetical protein
MSEKKFLFLYPIEKIIGFEIERWGWAEEGGKEKFREKYKNMLNECIDIRYRKNGFEINYVVFHGSSVSDVIQIQPTDKIIEVEIDFETHKTKSLYPNEDFILDRLGPIKTLRVAGFHLFDCVERVARRAYERRIDTLVDEDLTENFGFMIKDPEFKIDTFPSYNPRKEGDRYFEMFMRARRGKPWFWQDY